MLAMTMRPRLSRLFFALSLGGLAIGCKPPPAPPPPAPPRAPTPPTAAETTDAILAAYFAAHPVTATGMGVHDHDARWPDLSEAGIEAERTRIDAARSALGEVSLTTLDEQVDAEILLNALESDAFGLEVEQPWRTNPYWYVTLIGAGIDDLLSRDFAPVEARAAAVTARLLALPALVEQAKLNLDPAACMVPHTQVAIEQIDGLVTLVRSTALERLATAPDEVRTQVGAASSPAVMALRDLQQHLRESIVPNAAGTWRLGAENFQRKLALTLDDDVEPETLRRDAVIEHGRVRQDMAALAAELAEPLLGRRAVRKIRRRAEGDPDVEVTRAVLEALAQWHVRPEVLRDAIEVNLARLKVFVSGQDIVPMDDAEVLEVIWTPPHQQGVFIAGLAAPGPLEPQEAGLPSFYLVQPLPKAWSPEVSESFLREYNNFMLEILSIHEAIPGHFVQLYYGKREPSKIRRVLQNGAFVEGWAVYAERLMVEAGYDGVGPSPDAQRPDEIDRGLWTVLIDPELRRKAIALHALKFYLRTVTNAILDNGVHAGTMTREEALDLMIARSYQQEGEAVGKWTRAQLTATQLSTYFAGARAWRALREKARARGGFSASRFHAEALSHGAPPVEALPRLMGWTGETEPSASPELDAATPAVDEAPADETVDDEVEVEVEVDDEVDIEPDLQVDDAEPEPAPPPVADDFDDALSGVLAE